MKKLAVLLAVAGTTATVAMAVPRETFPFAGPFNLPGGTIGNPAPVTANVTGEQAGTYTPAFLRLVGTLQTNALTSSNVPNQARVIVIPPAGVDELFEVPLSTSFAAAPQTINFSTRINIPATVTNRIGTWTLSFYDTTNSGTGTDMVVSDVTLQVDDGVIAAVHDFGTLTSGTATSPSFSVAAGDVQWMKMTLATGVSVDTNTFVDIATVAGGDTEIGLYRNDGSLVTSDDDTLGFAGLSLLTFGSGENGADLPPRNGNDGALDAGTYWIAFGVYNMTFGATNFDVISTGVSGDITVEVKSGTFVPPPPPPPPSPIEQNFGTLGNAVVTNTGDYTAAAFKWFQFTTPEDASTATGKYVDIWTLADAYLGTNTFQNDTQIGLYRSAGSLRASDDQSGGNNLSALTFGDAATPRTTGDANTALLDGNDGSLVAGTYYLAVGGWIMTFNPGFNVTSTGDDAGPVTVKIGSNFAPTCVCCNVSNVAGPNQSTTPDNELTADDIIVFLGWYFAADARANVAGPNQSTTPDNELTADDIIVFLGRYFAGC